MAPEVCNLFRNDRCLPDRGFSGSRHHLIDLYNLINSSIGYGEGMASLVAPALDVSRLLI